MPTRRRGTHGAGPRLVRRVNVLLTAAQVEWLQARAHEEGRPLPNMIRRILDQMLDAHRRTPRQ